MQKMDKQRFKWITCPASSVFKKNKKTTGLPLLDLYIDSFAQKFPTAATKLILDITQTYRVQQLSEIQNTFTVILFLNHKIKMLLNTGIAWAGSAHAKEKFAPFLPKNSSRAEKGPQTCQLYFTFYLQFFSLSITYVNLYQDLLLLILLIFSLGILHTPEQKFVHHGSILCQCS